MDTQDHYSPEAINARALEKQREDFNDLQIEMGGHENGKIPRFTSEEERKRSSGRETSAQRAARTQLQMMLMQPEYAQAYYGTMNALNSAEDAVYDALKESADAVNDARKALEDAEKRGASEDELERLREIHKEAQERHEQMLARDAELEEIRRRMEDPNNPPTQEELAELEKRAKEIEAEANRDKVAKQSLDVSEPEKQVAPNSNFALAGFSPS